MTDPQKPWKIPEGVTVPPWASRAEIEGEVNAVLSGRPWNVFPDPDEEMLPTQGLYQFLPRTWRSSLKDKADEIEIFEARLIPAEPLKVELPTDGFDAYGMQIFELGDEGEYLIAFGHHDERRFLAACNRYAREVVHLDGPYDDSDHITFEGACGDTEWRMARFDPAPNEPDTEWRLHWADQIFDAQSMPPLPTVPVTVLTRW